MPDQRIRYDRRVVTASASGPPSSTRTTGSARAPRASGPTRPTRSTCSTGSTGSTEYAHDRILLPAAQRIT
jgi:hypothetical protein